VYKRQPLYKLDFSLSLPSFLVLYLGQSTWALPLI
jgi:hypothetical protein